MTEKLLPCPFCGSDMRLSAVARDWWRVAGGHNEDCILYDQRHDAPQTDYQKKALIDDWNRRAAQSAANAEPVGKVCRRMSQTAGLNGSVFYEGIEWLKAPPPIGTKLYTAPVAAQPSVLDDSEHMAYVAALPDVRCPKCDLLVLSTCDLEGQFSGCPVPDAYAHRRATAPTPPVDRQPWQQLAAALYQACGAYDMPVRVLDALSAAANGESFEHLIDGILPVESPADKLACPICHEDEPHTGSCGSSDPKAWCNSKADEQAQQNTLYPSMPDRSKWTLREEITFSTPIDHEGGQNCNQARYIITAAQLDRLDKIEEAAILAQQDADKVDAERYRAWRHAAVNNDAIFAKAIKASLPPDAREGKPRWPNEHEWDAAIDAARAIQERQP